MLISVEKTTILDIATMIGAVAAISGLLWAIWRSLRKDRREKIGRYIENKHDLDTLRRRLGADGPNKAYRLVISELNNKLESFYGQKVFGWFSLDRCLLIAVLYPFALFILAWVLGGPGKLAGLEILTPIEVIWDRQIRAAVLLGIICFVFSIFFYGWRFSRIIHGSASSFFARHYFFRHYFFHNNDDTSSS